MLLPTATPATLVPAPNPHVKYTNAAASQIVVSASSLLDTAVVLFAKTQLGFKFCKLQPCQLISTC
jgi:hypothetical protein